MSTDLEHLVLAETVQENSSAPMVEGDWLPKSFANDRGILSASHFQTLKRNTVGPGCSPSIWT